MKEKKFGFVLFKYAFSRCDLTVDLTVILCNIGDGNSLQNGLKEW